MWNGGQFNPEKHSLADWVRLKGGIRPSPITRDAEEIRHVASRKEAGYSLINYRGETLDQLTSDSIQDGWLPYHANHCDFLNMLGSDIQAKLKNDAWCRVWHPSKSWDEMIDETPLVLDDYDFLVAQSCSSCGNPEAETLYLGEWQDTICDACCDMLEAVCRGN
jgi:hypothetical protein